jgi:DNA modification methylase
MTELAESGVKVQMCVTSPPYYGLRDYKTGTWVGGDPECEHIAAIDVCEKCGAIREDHQIGLEETPEEYIQNMVEVFRGVRELLADDGVIWVNIGDSYYNYRPGAGQSMVKQTVSNTDQDLPFVCSRRGNKLNGLKEKDLIGIPWMLAFALRADGWYLRQDIIWNKPNPMPESVRDRCTKSHEYIFLLSKSKNYYFDNEAIKEPLANSSISRLEQDVVNQIGTTRANGGAKTNGNFKAAGNLESGMRNKRSVWTVNTKPYKGSHFAVYPEELIVPCILAGSREGDIVFDPFMGSGTTAAVSLKLGRHYLGCELNSDYVPLQEKRLKEAKDSLGFDGPITTSEKAQHWSNLFDQN